MKIMKIMLLGMSLAMLIAGCAPHTHTMKTTDTSGDRHDVLYTCNCGPQCKCNTVSTTPGNCACGAPLKWGHILKVEGNEAILCQCNEGCQCKGLNAEDPTKCNCGTKVKRVDLTGTGIYFCNCGGSCMCNTVSDKAGNCKCNMMLKQAN